MIWCWGKIWVCHLWVQNPSLAFVQGIHRWPVNCLHKRPVTRKMFPFEDVIMVHVGVNFHAWYVINTFHKKLTQPLFSQVFNFEKPLWLFALMLYLSHKNNMLWESNYWQAWIIRRLHVLLLHRGWNKIDDIFKRMFWNENNCIFIEISLKLVS